MRSAIMRKSEPASSTRARRSARLPAATSADTSARVDTKPSWRPSSVNTGATRSSPHDWSGADRVKSSMPSSTSTVRTRTVNGSRELTEASARVTISSTCSGASTERQLRPTSCSRAWSRKAGQPPLAKMMLPSRSVRITAIGPGLGDGAEQLADVVELEAQLLGVGDVEAGAGVALELAVGVEERQGPVVQPAVLAVAPGDPGGELERHPVVDVGDDGVGDLGQVVGVHGAEQRVAQVGVVGPDAEELEARVVADAGHAGPVGQPQHHRRLVHQPVGLRLARAGVGEVEDLREEVVGQAGRAVDGGDHGADPVLAAAGTGAAEVALEVVAVAGPQLLEHGADLERLDRVDVGLEPRPSDVVDVELHQVEEHGVGLHQLAVELDQTPMATGVASKTEASGSRWRARVGVSPAGPRALPFRGLCCRLFRLHALALPSRPPDGHSPSAPGRSMASYSGHEATARTRSVLVGSDGPSGTDRGRGLPAGTRRPA